MASRLTLAEDDGQPYRGGALSVHDKPKPRRYPCFATGCPMPGTIWPGAGPGGTGDRPGTCAWHYAVNDTDVPRVTRVLQDWSCVSDEIEAARQALTGPKASDPGALDALQAAAAARLRPRMAAGGWSEELEPQRGERYGDWCKRLEGFLGARVVEVLSARHRRAA